MRAFLLLSVLLLSSLSAVCGQQYFAFCWTTTNTNPNSPTLPWSVSMSGTLSVNVSAGLTQGTYSWYLGLFPASQQLSGYLVTGATGTRTIYAQGTSQTTTITGVAPINAYNGNDNIIATTAPYFDNLAHSITFTLNTNSNNPPLFATGPIPSGGVVVGNTQYVNINNYTYPLYGGSGVQESDDPPNDGQANVMVSTFTLTPTTSFVPSVSCSNTAVQPPAAPSSFSTSLQWSFCYTFTGGGNFATTNGQQWFTTGSGTITTTGYAGTTLNGRQGYLITGMTGTRTYTNAGTGQSQSVGIVGVGGPNTQQAVAYYSEQFDWLYKQGLESDLSNNILYTSYPYFDQWGVSVITNSFVGNEDQSNLTVNAFRLWVDPYSWSFNEWVTDFTAGYWYFTYSASSIVVPQSTMSASALLPQCSPTYGSTVYFQFCYYIDNLASTSLSAPASFTYAYGVITATGPVMRNGRMAYTAQTINGVRSITVGGQTTSAGIIYLEWIQSDLNWGFINNNLIYANAPYIDQQGIIFATSAGPVFANGSVPLSTEVYYGYTDVAVAANTVGNNSAGAYAGIYEQSVLTPSLVSIGAASSAFNVAMMSGPGTPNSATCAYSGNNPSYITPIATQTYSFCYMVNGADNGGWQTYTSGTITVYTTPINNAGTTAYAIANITGTRTYQSSSGQTSTVTITGINSNNQGADGWVYDNLLYPQAPYFDSDGLVYNFAGTAQTAYGNVQGDGVNAINIFTYTNFFQEEFYTSATLSVYGDVVGPAATSFQLSADGGAAGLAGTFAQQCMTPVVAGTSNNVVATKTLPFCYAISNTLSTSPFMPWAVVTTGTFTVVSNSYSTGVYQQSAEYPGYLIQSGTAQRTLYSAQSATPQTQTITVLPVNSYNTNDNILQPAATAYGPAPAYPLLSLHGISFSTGTSAVALPTGTVNSIYGPLNNITLVGWQYPAPSTSGGSMPITEADLPFNDGVTSTIVAIMKVGYDGSTPSCTGSGSPVVIPTQSASITSTFTATTTYQFCYYFTGVDHLGSNWTIATSGQLTTSGYQGTTTTGLAARLVTGVSGSRVLTLGNSSTFTTPLLGVGGFNSYQYQAENMADEQFSTYFSANNILYMQWPYFDQYGLALQGSSSFWLPNGGGLNTGNTALKLFIDPATYDVAEWLLDWSQFVYYVGEAGSLQVSPTSSVSNTNDFNAQCQANYGSLVTYQWCYFADRSGGNGPNRYYVQAYGTMTASGPVTRQGRTAYTIQSMTGVRTFTNVATGVSSTNPILSVQYTNYDEGYGGGSGLTFWVNNDNVVYSSAPALDEAGIIYGTFPTPNNPQFAQGTAATGDIQINVNQTFRNGANLAFQENGVGTESSSTNAASAFTVSTNYGFSFTQGGLSSTSQCSAQSTRFQYPSLTTYSWCYAISGVPPAGYGTYNYTVSASGTLTVYNVSVTSTLQYPNVPASIIAGVTGYRQWQDSTGNQTVATITGLGSNWYAEDGWDYDQLLYSNNLYFDSYGLLFTFTGNAQSYLGPVYGDNNANVINIFNDGTNFQEEGWTGNFRAAYDIGGTVNGATSTTFQIVQDGGSSYNSGSLLRNQCGYQGSFPSPSGSSNSGGGGGGLSGGKIAGAVIGAVVGALLLLALLFLLVTGCAGRSGKSSNTEGETTKSTGKYATQSEESRVEQSQVELQDTNTEA